MHDRVHAFEMRRQGLAFEIDNLGRAQTFARLDRIDQRQHSMRNGEKLPNDVLPQPPRAAGDDDAHRVTAPNL